MRRMVIPEQIPWHVVVRGARRLQLFHDTEDYQVFLSMLGEATRHASTGCAAYTLLSNHGHLALIGNSVELSECMGRLDRAYSGYHNRKYGLAGHTFDQAYFAQPVRNDYVLQRVVRYIHLNPVRAGLSSRPEDYRWSDYSRLINALPDRYATCQSALLRTYAAEDVDPLQAYVDFVEAGLRRPRRPKPTTHTAMEIWQEQFYWILELAESKTWKDRWEPIRAAAMAAARAGIPPRAIGFALGDNNGLRISQLLYRTRRSLKEHPELEEPLRALDIL